MLNRKDDESGVSGTGIVAEGVIFDSGKVAVSFMPFRARGKATPSVIVYDCIEHVEQVHGHLGKTEVILGPVIEFTPNIFYCDGSADATQVHRPVIE